MKTLLQTVAWTAVLLQLQMQLLSAAPRPPPRAVGAAEGPSPPTGGPSPQSRRPQTAQGPGRPAARSNPILSPLNTERPEVDVIIHQAHLRHKNRPSRPGSSGRDASNGMVEMDMKLTEVQMAALHRQSTSVGGVNVARIAISDEAFRWTNAVIPYTISSVFSATERQMILDGMAEWEKYTCVSFVPRGSQENYVSIISAYGCWSEVGMVRRGKQELSIEQGACTYSHTIVHELAHAIGMHHIQTRPDRDNHVNIREENIQSGLEYNFEKYDWDYVRNYGVKYDYISVMHYSAYAFSRNGRRTIETLDKDYQDVIGSVPGASARDIATVNLMYRCTARCSQQKKESCPGILGPYPDCTCWCNTGNPGEPVKEWDGSSQCKAVNDDSDPCVDYRADCEARADQGECDSNPGSMLQDCRKSCQICGPNAICKNYNPECESWSLRGECERNPSWMNRHCRKACFVCGSPPTDPAQCTNQYEDLCETAASRGYCDEYRDSMLERCSKACKACPDNPTYFTCRNWHVECNQWEKEGMCTSSADRDWMKQHCPFACGYCSSSTVPDCKNYASDADCEDWRGKGECEYNPGWMFFNCAKSCRTCTADASNVATTKACLDRSDSCQRWEAANYCTSDSVNMWFYCPISCDICTPQPGTHNSECQDFSPWCGDFASQGLCQSEPDLMLWSCPKTCNICGPNPVCDDYHDQCDQWRSEGECEANPTWMERACAKSCNSCPQPSGSTTSTTTSTTTTATTITTTTATTTTTSPTTTTTIPDTPGCTDIVGTDTCSILVETGTSCSGHNKDWMVYYCAKTCLNCGPNEICSDHHVDCAYWESTNQCAANPGYMHNYCRKSCNVCDATNTITTTTTTTTSPWETTTLSDFDQRTCWDYGKDWCEERANLGHCETRRSYMFANCPVTCDVCGPGVTSCQNYDNSCQSWANAGECEANPGYMLLYCRKACEVCT